MPGPLEGIRVLDLTQALFGPFATMLLSDMGAEVIKVEKTNGGDICRGNGPFVNGLSTYFLSLNRGKKSTALNLSTKQGAEIFLNLTKSADVVIENYTPGKIVYVAGSGFGQYGPYTKKPAFDVIVQAMGGVMSVTGEEGGGPIRPGASYGDIGAGLFLCIATLAALQERNKSGEGQYVDVGMLDCHPRERIRPLSQHRRGTTAPWYETSRRNPVSSLQDQ